jgi:hypothetical protein
MEVRLDKGVAAMTSATRARIAEPIKITVRGSVIAICIAGIFVKLTKPDLTMVTIPVALTMVIGTGTTMVIGTGTTMVIGTGTTMGAGVATTTTETGELTTALGIEAIAAAAIGTVMVPTAVLSNSGRQL